MMSGPVLITWVAINNDPFERERGAVDYKLVNGERVPGPTLTLLMDEASPYAGQIRDVVLLHRRADGPEDGRERRAVDETSRELREQLRGGSVHVEPWSSDDPTDHESIFEFLRETLPALRRRFESRELIIHISPGTPSMQTIWVLMAETGFVEEPFTLVKSYRKSERRGRPATVPVRLGLETFYKRYKASRPRQVGSEDQAVIWDPGRFQTDALKQVFAEARRFAQLNVPVLIRGERGTGKTTLANWIRSNSPFKREEQDARWPSVACGQYGPETMRAELFGYKKGAFTGATSDREGLLAAAHRDTLFLDEVGDVSPDLQRLLIRALEEKRYFALGDDTPKESDFRLLTATNVDDAEIRRRLDPDFLDRISLLTLSLPSLREVPGELRWLWDAVYEQAVRRSGVTQRRARLGAEHHERVVAHLRRHPLPGNLRDLFRVAYRVLVARNDVDNPMPPADAVAYGIDSLAGGPVGASELPTMARSLAAAFTHSAPIGDLVPDGQPLPTAEIFAELKSFIAQEVRRLSTQRGVKASELCDVSERSLREWAKNGKPPRKTSADVRQGASEKKGQ